MSANALFIGAACIDVVIYLERLPKTEENIHPWKQTVSLGGCACNAARAARLVCDRITFAGPVGTGVFGELAERELAKSGLSVSIRTEKENGCCYCFVEDGGKSTFMSVHGGEYAFDRCPNLRSVMIGDGVETIAKGAFDKDFALERVVLPASVRTIAEKAFPENVELVRA